PGPEPGEVFRQGSGLERASGFTSTTRTGDGNELLGRTPRGDPEIADPGGHQPGAEIRGTGRVHRLGEANHRPSAVVRRRTQEPAEGGEGGLRQGLGCAEERI